jgi:hypothetical protein
MTSERKRALLIIVSTFLIGALIGALTMALMNRHRGGGRQRGSIGWHDGGREAFIKKIGDVVEADSNQARQMRPYILQTIQQIDSLQSHSTRQVHAVVDSFEMKVKPFLTQEQMEDLHRFHQRGRKIKRGGGR